MTTLKYYAPDARSETLPITGPVESRVKIQGLPCVLRTWTRSQWDLLDQSQRPAVAWWHGDMIATLVPDE